ncbi:MAG: hypothetical protein [Olavius algarvensis Gamma 3 endosymbiont]|nr:MAG: hypothetical protein [Olavius algarvensis Gamma 3 endosymbiont]
MKTRITGIRFSNKGGPNAGYDLMVYAIDYRNNSRGER